MSLRYTGEDSGEGSCRLHSLTFLTPCALWWLLLHGKMSLIHIKRAKNVPFYLWKFLLPFCFLPYTLYFVRDMLTSTGNLRNPENLFNQHGNWISYHLLPIPHTSEFWLITVFVPFLAKRLALTCCSAQKSICVDTFCGVCDLDSPISLWLLLVMGSNLPWFFFFSDISFFCPILCTLTPRAV